MFPQLVESVTVLTAITLHRYYVSEMINESETTKLKYKYNDGKMWHILITTW